MSLSRYHFLQGPEDAHLAEANVEGRALQRAIGLFHDNDVNAAGKGGGIEAPVQLLDLDEHLARQLSHEVHGLTGLRGGGGWLKYETEQDKLLRIKTINTRIWKRFTCAA